MIDKSDITKMLYATLKAAVADETIPIDGDVYNTFRPLNSKDEDITVSTLSVSGNGIPYNAVIYVNAFVRDIPEKGGGLVRDGKRLDTIGHAVSGVVGKFNYPCTAVNNVQVTESSLGDVHQHFLIFRIDMDIYTELQNE